jgi:hypothetical protein
VVVCADSVQVAAMMASKTVLLRLLAGSQEAEYLAAICPMPLTPTLVIIQYAKTVFHFTSQLFFILSHFIIETNGSDFRVMVLIPFSDADPQDGCHDTIHRLDTMAFLTPI